jgi:hypothetical protein
MRRTEFELVALPNKQLGKKTELNLLSQRACPAPRFGQKIFGANCSIAKQVQRRAAGALKIPIRHLHSALIIHGIPAILRH